MGDLLCPGLFALAAPFFPARDFRAGTPRFRQADGDRLLAALDLFAGAAAAQRAALALVHRPLDLALRLLSVACHAGIVSDARAGGQHRSPESAVPPRGTARRARATSARSGGSGAPLR